MNIIQKIVLIIGLFALIYAIVFPNWVLINSIDPKSKDLEVFVKRDYLYKNGYQVTEILEQLNELSPYDHLPFARIDYNRMVAEVVLILFSTAIIVLIFGNKKGKATSNDQEFIQ